jgi:hypothetical protein
VVQFYCRLDIVGGECSCDSIEMAGLKSELKIWLGNQNICSYNGRYVAHLQSPKSFWDV